MSGAGSAVALGMALCYRISYSGMFGTRVAFKWGEDEKDALSLLKKSHDKHGGMGIGAYGVPVPVNPQPFTPESRGVRADFWQQQGSGLAPPKPLDSGVKNDPQVFKLDIAA